MYNKGSLKRKFSPGPYVSSGSGYGLAPVHLKRVRIARAPPFRPSRSYVPRTPGGSITADNHYYDGERTATTIASNTASWTGSEYDVNSVPTGVLAVACLFAPLVGNDIINREGRKCFLKKIRISGVITVAVQSVAATADPAASVRIVLYQDMQTNATQSQGEDLLSSGTAADAIHMYQNYGNLGRFKVWYDKFHVIEKLPITGAAAAIEQSGTSRNFKITIKPNCMVNFNATNGGTVADIIDNSFHLIANTQSAGLAPTITYKSRCVFTG